VGTIASSDHPMMLRATEMPIATPTDVLPPMATAPATPRTSAVMVPVLVAEMVTCSTGLSAVPRDPPSTPARVLPTIWLVETEPPPARARAGFPPAMPTDTATAIDCTRMVAAFSAVMTTPSGARTVPGLATRARTWTSISLNARDSPMEPAPPLPPDRLAATAAAWASAVIDEVSAAVTRRAPSVWIAVSVAEASIRIPILLSVNRPPTATANAVSEDSATATEVASTTAVMIALETAEMRMSPVAVRSDPVARAFTSIGATPPNSDQPIRLRATETPIAMAGVVPVAAPPTATASAATRASISAE